MTGTSRRRAPDSAERAAVRAGRRLAEVEELSGIGSWEWDILGDELHWSEQLCRVYGVEPDPRPMTFDEFIALVHPDDRDAVVGTVRGALQAGTPFVTEHRAVHPDGSIHLIYGRGYVLTDDDGNPTRMLGSGQDVTEERAAERERTAEERRKAAGQARDEALALIAHDLRSPLAVVVGYVQLLERQARGGTINADKLLPYLERVNVAARQMTSFLDDLLSDAEPMADAEPLDTEPVELVAYLRETAEHHDEISAQHTVVARLPRAPVVANVNAAKLERALHNLIRNAITYSPQGGTITVSLDADPREVRIGVADEGIGIPPADLPRIFDRFHRAANVVGTTTGLGLGLISVQRAVRAHGGRIEVDSVEGVGTTFTIHLPRGT